ncbi:MAG: hypothetical protein H8K07_06225 [Nitrospira sp.]|nr:hypothetical protein [Nitrospira sp.]
MQSQVSVSLTIRQLKQAVLCIAVITSGTILAASCSHENTYRAELASPLNANAETGVIILSAGSTAPCHLFSPATGLRIFHLEGVHFPFAAVAKLDVNNRYVESEFSDHHGRLYVFPLRAGKYFLEPYLMHAYVYYSHPPRAEFEVHPNETSYLGEFFMPRECGGDGGMQFVDQEARDVGMLVAKNPAFAKVAITKRLLLFTGRQSFWGGLLGY